MEDISVPGAQSADLPATGQEDHGKNAATRFSRSEVQVDERNERSVRAPAGVRRLAQDWWQRRGLLGVRNWEVLVILLVALVVGVVATVGSSMVGVR